MSAGPILSFDGEFRFLSNFWPSPIDVPVWGSGLPLPDGLMKAATVEHAFQARKAASRDDLLWVLRADSPGNAKRRGSVRGEDGVRIKLRPDWEQVKRQVMLACLRAKFVPGSELADLLLSTGCRMLVEGNTWGDRTWGAVWGAELMTLDGAVVPQKVWARRENTVSGGVGVLVGENWLGRLLMLVRAELDCQINGGATT